VLVLSSLLGALVLTSVLLLILAPAPLTPDAVRSLYITQRDSFDPVFQFEKPITPGRWRYIYIHHSNGRSGSVASLMDSAGLADHFVIGNGDGSEDGEIEISPIWHQQQAARPARGRPAAAVLARVYEKAITICLVGDFDHSAPSANQMASLQQLVRTLQEKLNIPSGSVVAFDRPGSSEGIGRLFPTAELSSHLLP
jgi:hypothetical protein